MPKLRHVQVVYEISKVEIEALIRQYFQAEPLTSITWDITNQGKVRGATITMNQVELSSNDVNLLTHEGDMK